MEWNTGEAGLYDHEIDAHEFVNLAKDRNRAEVVQQLQAVLRPARDMSILVEPWPQLPREVLTCLASPLRLR